MGGGAPAAARAASDRFDASETATPRVDAKSLITIPQNRYSVPVALAGLKVSAKIGAREITIDHGGVEVARHERLHGRCETSAQLDHYVELLAGKPGGLERSVALAQERDRGRCPIALMFCGPGWSIAMAARTPPVRWSMSCCSAAITLPPGRDGRQRRVDRRSELTDARSLSWPAAHRAPGRPWRRSPTWRPGSLRISGPHRISPIRPADRRCPMTTPARNAQTAALEALIEAHAIDLKLPTVRRRFKALAAEALREQQTRSRISARYSRLRWPSAPSDARAAADRRSVPADQATGGLPLPGQPKDPAGHDRRARRGVLDR